MIAQFYTDSNPIISLYDGNQKVADLPLPVDIFGQPEVSLNAARIALKLLGFRAKEKWMQCSWGWETRVSRISK